MSLADRVLDAAEAAGLRPRVLGSRARMRCPTCGTHDDELAVDLDREIWICHRCARHGVEVHSGRLARLLDVLGHPPESTSPARMRRRPDVEVCDLVNVAAAWPLLVESQTEADAELVAQWATGRGWPAPMASSLAHALRDDVATLHERPGHGEAVAGLNRFRTVRRQGADNRWIPREYPLAFAFRDELGIVRDVERRTLGPVADPFKKGYRLPRSARVAADDELLVTGNLTSIRDGGRVHVVEGVPTYVAARLCFPDDVVVGASSGILPRLGRALRARAIDRDLALDVVLWPDLDETGMVKMGELADELVTLAAVRWAMPSTGTDLADVLAAAGVDGVLACLDSANIISAERPRLTSPAFADELGRLWQRQLTVADENPGSLYLNATIAGAGKTTAGVRAAAAHGAATGSTSAYLVRTVGAPEDDDGGSLLSEAAAIARAGGVSPVEVRGALRSCRLVDTAPMAAAVYAERGRAGLCGPKAAPKPSSTYMGPSQFSPCDWAAECAGSPANRPTIGGPLVLAAHQWGSTSAAAGVARLVVDETPSLVETAPADSWAVSTLTTSERAGLTAAGRKWADLPDVAGIVTAAELVAGRIGAAAESHVRAIKAGADPWPRVMYAAELAAELADCLSELRAAAPDPLLVDGSPDPLAPPMPPPARARSPRSGRWPSVAAYRAVRALCGAVADPTATSSRRVSVRIEAGGQWRIEVRSPWALPAGVPVILSDATAHLRRDMLSAVTGRRVEVAAVDCLPRRAASAIHVRTGHFRTSEICTPDRWGSRFWYRGGIAAAVRRVLVTAIAEAARVGVRGSPEDPRTLAIITHKRLALGLLGDVEVRDSDSPEHRAEVAALGRHIPELAALGWTLLVGWYGRDDRGQNRMERAAVMMTIGDPRDDWGSIQADAHFAGVDAGEDGRGRVRSVLTQSHARPRTARHGGTVHVHAGDAALDDLPDVGRGWATTTFKAGPAPHLSRAYALDLLISWADRDGFLAAPLAVAALMAAGVKERTAYRLAAAEAETRRWQRHELITRTGRAVVWAPTEDAAKAAPLLGTELAGGGLPNLPITNAPKCERSKTRGAVCPDVRALDPGEGVSRVAAALSDLVADPLTVAASIVLVSADAAAEVRNARARYLDDLDDAALADELAVDDEIQRHSIRTVADRDRRVRLADSA